MIVILAAVAQCAFSATTWNAATDWSSTSADNPIWDYGYIMNNAGGPPNVVTWGFMEEHAEYVPVPNQLLGWKDLPYSQPILWNSVGYTGMADGAYKTPGHIYNYRGLASYALGTSTLRFTAPETGSYQVSGAMWDAGMAGYGHAQTGWIYLNTTKVWEQALPMLVEGTPPTVVPQAYDLTLPLAAGDTLYFLTTRIGDEQVLCGGMDANVAIVPEPSALLLMGLGGVLGLSRRRK